MFTRILMAIDGSESGEVAVSFVTPLARESKAKVHVVYVNEVLVGGRGMTVSTHQEARNIVDSAVAALWMAGVDADGEVRRGNCFSVDDRIVDSARVFGADVIVLGSNRRRWLRRFSGKGMRERVTALTDLPTLTAPAPLRMTHQLQRDMVQLSNLPLEGVSISAE
jgi:nucleotide-binding universal stress UspA family protein